MKNNKPKEKFDLKSIVQLNIFLLMSGVVFVNMRNVIGGITVNQKYPYVYFGVTIGMLIGVIILFPIVYHGIYSLSLKLIHKTFIYLIELVLGIFIMTSIIYGLTNYSYLDVLNGLFGNGEFDRLTEILLGLCNMVSIGMFVGVFTNLYEKEIDDRLE